MSVRHRRLPPISQEIDIAEFDTEMVVLVAGSRRAVHLEVGYALVMDSCRSGHGEQALVDELRAVLHTDDDSVRNWIGDVLREFARIGIIDPGDLKHWR